MAPQRVLDGMLAAGARLALPGEFTRRAFLNGRMDLVQAEATADLVDARSPAMAEAAVHQLSGALSRRIGELHERLLHLRSLLVYEIDFPEEDDGAVDPARVEEARAGVLGALDALLGLAPEGELLRDGALTVIAGRPNAGKSSLFNGLVGLERAIVTEVPGTTRDAVDAVIGIEGYPFRLVDTAGLREEAERIEGLGIDVARDYLARADLVLFCVEAGRAPTEEEQKFLRGARHGAKTLLVRTKSDLSAGEAGDGIPVSALTGEGLPDLRRRMLEASFGGLREAGPEPFVTRARQVRALRAARQEVEAFGSALVDGLSAEVAETHLQEAGARLEELLGVVDTEDLLEAVFGQFCIGK